MKTQRAQTKLATALQLFASIKTKSRYAFSGTDNRLEPSRILGNTITSQHYAHACGVCAQLIDCLAETILLRRSNSQFLLVFRH